MDGNFDMNDSLSLLYSIKILYFLSEINPNECFIRTNYEQQIGGNNDVAKNTNDFI